jgi:hypothetical protein
MRTMALETYKIVNKSSPEFLHNLITLKENSYNFRYKLTVNLRINHVCSKEYYDLYELQEQFSEKHHVEIKLLKLPKFERFRHYKTGCTRLAAACDKVYQLLAHGRWYFPGTLASSTTKTDRHDIAEILLKVALKHQKSINLSPHC